MEDTEIPYLRRGSVVTLKRESPNPRFFDKIPEDIKGIIFWVDWVYGDIPEIEHQEAKIIWDRPTGLSVHWSASSLVILEEGHDDSAIVERKLAEFLCVKYSINGIFV